MSVLFRKKIQRRVLKKNPLKNLRIMIKLNPYAKTMRRNTILRHAQNVSETATGGAGSRDSDVALIDDLFVCFSTNLRKRRKPRPRPSWQPRPRLHPRQSPLPRRPRQPKQPRQPSPRRRPRLRRNRGSAAPGSPRGLCPGFVPNKRCWNRESRVGCGCLSRSSNGNSSGKRRRGGRCG